MARTVIDQSMIIKINNAYLKLHTYAAVARELGISASTVSKYIIKDYHPIQMENIKKFDYDNYKNCDHIPFEIKEDLSNELVLTSEEKEELKELWEELSI